MTTPPLWLVALVLAALAPWGARWLQAYFERRLRRRTLAVLARMPRPPRAAAEDHPESRR